jgi:hypothetical protein
MLLKVWILFSETVTGNLFCLMMGVASLWRRYIHWFSWSFELFKFATNFSNHMIPPAVPQFLRSEQPLRNRVLATVLPRKELTEFFFRIYLQKVINCLGLERF